MKDILQAGCALRNHINAYEKQESSKKGKRGFPLGAVKKFYFTSRRPTAALFLPSLAYRLAQEEPMNSPQDCSLNGSSHHTTDDPLLGEDVDDEDRAMAIR